MTVPEPHARAVAAIDAYLAAHADQGEHGISGREIVSIVLASIRTVEDERPTVEAMAQAFLTWKLPPDFHPDDGISFDLLASRGTPHERRREPSGTNLLNCTQAEAMVRHMLSALPALPHVAADAAKKGQS